MFHFLIENAWMHELDEGFVEIEQGYIREAQCYIRIEIIGTVTSYGGIGYGYNGYNFEQPRQFFITENVTYDVWRQLTKGGR